MAKSTRHHVFDGMELLPDALIPFVEKRLETSLGKDWRVQILEKMQGLKHDRDGMISWDQASLLNTMDRFWTNAFKSVLGRAERSIVNELVDVRNKLSHNEPFTYDDAERALDSMRRLMEAISAGETSDKISEMRDTILRTKFTELQRNEERRKTQRLDISVGTVAGILPWREVVEPHEDVATGVFTQAEFAADLSKVHTGSAPSEYLNPAEFFARTYLTEGLSDLLVGAVKRLSNAGGDPVVELQTNFGGGKTHSMLALYHMAGEARSEDLTGLDQLLSKYKLKVPAKITRAVLVGTSRGPLDGLNLEGGYKIHTTWGELAWQLGGKEAFEMIIENDEKGIAPGSKLLEDIFKKYAPNLILIDEWVAYLRQIYRVDGLSSGSFDANLSFVQSLTEAVKACPRTLLVASLPASQIEVGGEGGDEALKRLKQTFSRVESSWRPASQEESYEIVRRRLFKEIPGSKFHHRDNTLKQFAKMYRENSADFPHGCANEDYRRKLEKAYPIHPELFDQLYTSWGSLEKFQRTRGVLRLMAQVIHELWMNHDPSTMIMPGSLAISSARVEPELLHYLNASWQSIIAGDVDGMTSTPYKIDQSAPNLNRYCATRRVARTIFMGTAPIHSQENRGLDDKQINLGVVQPGERPAIFSDALRRLTDRAKFMHGDLGRYWYSVKANLNRIAADSARQVEETLVLLEIDKALKAYINSLSDRGHFNAVQVVPSSSIDVPDEPGGIRAVVLGVEHSHNGKDDSLAMIRANEIFIQRGSIPRVYRNMLIFLAAESRQLQNLKDSIRASIAWSEIVRDTQKLDLTQSDSAFAKAKAAEANETVKTSLKEAWNYLLYPYQDSAQADVEWVFSKVPTQDGLLVHASKRLVNDQAIWPELGPDNLNRQLEKYIWNEKNHLLLSDIWEYLNRYTYLPRLKNQEVLSKAVQSAISGIFSGPFAYAERWDEKSKTYIGLTLEKAMNVSAVIDRDSVIVRPDVGERHRPVNSQSGMVIEKKELPQGDASTFKEANDKGAKAEHVPTRFRGTAIISPDRPARDMNRIFDSIVQHLTTIPDASVELKLEIDAEIPSGINKAKSKTLLENANTLGLIDKTLD